MQGTMIYSPRDIRFENRPEPTITKPTDVASVEPGRTAVVGGGDDTVGLLAMLSA